MSLHQLTQPAMARSAIAPAPLPAPMPKTELDPVSVPDDEGRAKAGPDRAKEPELRDALRNTPWLSILVPLGVGLAAMAVSIILVFTAK